MEIEILIKPFLDLFTRSQVQSVLLAWLPTKLTPYLTGIITVDMFITTVLATGISAFAYLIYQLIYDFLTKSKNGNKIKSICIQIEYYALGQYNERTKNIFYESMSWLISHKSKKLVTGSFVLKVLPNVNSKGNVKILPNSNVLPEIDHEIFIEYKGKHFSIKYKIPERKNNININNINSEIISMVAQEKPSIYLATFNNSCASVDELFELLNDITSFYLELQKKEKGRFRYENTRSHWIQIQKLSPCRGLDSIAIDEKQELLLKKELNTFVNDRKFYENLGLSYKRGILLYGKPGTGKTSLINAISSHLSRDIYYLNLKLIEDDSELSALFSSVPSNQLIVLEDVDSQSKILYKRNILPGHNVRSKSEKDKKIHFSLSTFLACLDGHILSEGCIIIMTTNHLEYLDPACIRPGRMDLHLELDYCTRYQLKKLFKSVISHLDVPDILLKSLPEKILPPCELMTTLTLYREDNVEIIVEKILDLISKYQDNNENLKILETEKMQQENYKKRKFIY